MQPDSGTVFTSKINPAKSITDKKERATTSSVVTRKIVLNQPVLALVPPQFSADAQISRPAKGFQVSSSDWTETLRELKNAIKIRHYSPKILKTCTGWTRKFQTHVRSKDPALISVEDVKAFLTWLAVEKNASASSQNQAFKGVVGLTY